MIHYSFQIWYNAEISWTYKAILVNA